MTLAKQLVFHAERSREAGNHASAIFCEQAAIEVSAMRAFIDDAFEAHSNLDLDVKRVRELRKLSSAKGDKERSDV